MSEREVVVYKVVVTIGDESSEESGTAEIIPSEWKRTPPGPDGVSRFYPTEDLSDWEYNMQKKAKVAWRKSMRKIWKGFI